MLGTITPGNLIILQKMGQYSNIGYFYRTRSFTPARKASLEIDLFIAGWVWPSGSEALFHGSSGDLTPRALGLRSPRCAEAGLGPGLDLNL